MARTSFTGPVASANGFLNQSTNSNGITVTAPAALAASYTLTLPPNDGTDGQVLTTDGNGVTTWTSNGSGSGTVTSVAGAGTVNGLTLTGTVTSSGSLTLGGAFVLPTSTAAAIGAVANAINTSGKTVGKMVVDLSTGIIYTATGTAAADPWGATTGTPVTPA